MRHAVRALVAVSLLVAAGTAGLVAAGGRVDAGGGALASPDRLDGAPAPAIRLRDARGAAVDSRDLRGRPYLVTFVYTGCRDVCPVIGADVAAALRRSPRLAALIVSVDPRGDTAAKARRWLEDHRLPATARYLLGTRSQLEPVWRDWHLLPAGRSALDPRTHAAAVWLVDAGGRLRARWPAGASIDVAAELRR